MKNTFRFLFVLYSVVTVAHPLQSQWIQMSGPNTIPSCFVVSGNNIFAGTLDGGVCRSTNSGASWTPINSGMTNLFGNAVAVSSNGAGDTNIFAGGRGVFRSTDNGTSWTAAGLSLLSVKCLAISPATGGTGDPNIFAGTRGNGVYRSTDNGTNWTPVNTGLTSYNIWALAVSPATGGTGGTNLFAGCYAEGGGFFRSIDNGTNWTAANTGLTDSLDIQSLAVVGTNLFAATYFSVFRSANGGSSWSGVSQDLPRNMMVVAGSGTHVFAGGYGGGIFHSTNNGKDWTAVNDGLTNTYIWALAVIGTNVFAGTAGGGGFWRRPLSEMVTGVENASINLPTHFRLDQNYPNPFNPSTTISFNLPSRSAVSLKIFDALGREVSLLLADELAAGTHTRQWNAAGLPSGFYFCRMEAHHISGGQAGMFTETKKLLLLK
jgi:hypothetical protein